MKSHRSENDEANVFNKNKNQHKIENERMRMRMRIRMTWHLRK